MGGKVHPEENKPHSTATVLTMPHTSQHVETPSVLPSPRPQSVSAPPPPPSLGVPTVRSIQTVPISLPNVQPQTPFMDCKVLPAKQTSVQHEVEEAATPSAAFSFVVPRQLAVKVLAAKKEAAHAAQLKVDLAAHAT